MLVYQRVFHIVSIVSLNVANSTPSQPPTHHQQVEIRAPPSLCRENGCPATVMHQPNKLWQVSVDEWSYYTDTTSASVRILMYIYYIYIYYIYIIYIYIIYIYYIYIFTGRFTIIWYHLFFFRRMTKKHISDQFWPFMCGFPLNIMDSQNHVHMFFFWDLFSSNIDLLTDKNCVAPAHLGGTKSSIKVQEHQGWLSLDHQLPYLDDLGCWHLTSLINDEWSYYWPISITMVGGYRFMPKSCLLLFPNVNAIQTHRIRNILKWNTQNLTQYQKYGKHKLIDSKGTTSIISVLQGIHACWCVLHFWARQTHTRVTWYGWYMWLVILASLLPLISLEELGSCIKMFLGARMVMLMIMLMNKNLLTSWDCKTQQWIYWISGYTIIQDLNGLALSTIFQKGQTILHLPKS